MSCLEITKVFAVRIKDDSILMQSSSGGAFTAFANFVLDNGGAVACVVYDYQAHCAKYDLIDSKKELSRARGSKYIQSFTNDIFQKAYNWIRENSDKILLFVGTGCYADGFRKYAIQKRIIDRVLIVDIVCHGTPSPQIWTDYVLSLQNNHNIDEVNFRAKIKNDGWRDPTSYVKLDEKIHKINDYMKVFYEGYILRPSCYKCQYASTSRKVDITIGDFWHIEDKLPEFYDCRGNSLVLIHTKKGFDFFESIKHDIEFEESCIEDSLQNNLIKPTSAPPNRSEFWDDYNRMGIKKTIRKYGHTSFIKKVSYRIKKYI